MWHTAWMFGYKVVAKIYDNGSSMGIDNGRVSKLEIWKGSKRLVHYDRSWVDGQHLFPHEFLDHIVTTLEHLF